MSEIILVNPEDVSSTIEEEKELWVNKVLVALGADAERLGEDDAREYLMSLQLEVWNNVSEGTVDIFREMKLVGQWKVPKLIKKRIKGEKDYYEIHLSEWALPFQMQRRK